MLPYFYSLQTIIENSVSYPWDLTLGLQDENNE
jgi:hypothetical protein